jgi:hypothetical protein
MPEPTNPPAPRPPSQSIEESVKAAVSRISHYVDDVSTLQVETRYLIIGPEVELRTQDVASAFAAAKSEIRIDGDSFTVVPVRMSANGEYVFQEALSQVHDRNVAAAIQYRAEIMMALKDVLTELGKKIA